MSDVTTRRGFAVEVLDADHHLEGFDCGVAELNAYLVGHALANAASGFGVTHVLLELPDRIVIGYYTLVSAHILKQDFLTSKERWREGLPPYDVPVVRLARLAVDTRSRQAGIGGHLLADALKRALAWSRHIGARGVDVHAIDERAVRFYQKYGFRRLRDSPEHLFLPMDTIRASF